MAFRSYLEPRKPFNINKKRRSAPQRIARQTPRGGGRLSKEEKAIIAHIAQDTPGELSREQIQSTAMMLRRNPRTIAQAIREAREKLQDQAEKYVDIHLQAAEAALAGGEFDTARKAAEWAIMNISARNSEGGLERIVEKADTELAVPHIQIGIALGGIPPRVAAQ